MCRIFPTKIGHFARFFVLVLKMSEEAKSMGSSEQKLESSVPEAGESMSTSSAHPMDEVFHVNRLLQIEDLDWTRQLKQAVSNFPNIIVTPVPFCKLCLTHDNSLSFRVLRILVSPFGKLHVSLAITNCLLEKRFPVRI